VTLATPRAAWPTLPAPAAPAVSLAQVTARYKGAERASVDRLSLAVHRGEIFGLLGPNGSGKTTTINMIIGLMAPSRGTVQVFGRDPASEAARRLMGVVTQETALYERLSARDNLALYAALYGYRGQQKRQRVAAALQLADLAQVADKRAGTFSGGMARRLQIGRALLHSPQLVVLDEPTLGVDPVQRADLWNHIRALRDAGKTVLLTTNVMDEASALCDRIAIIHGGRLAAPVDTPAALQRGRGAVITVAAEADHDDLAKACAVLDADPDVTDVTATRGPSPGLYQVLVTAGDAGGVTGKVIMHLTAGGVVIRDVATRTASLDEVFLAVTGSFQAAS